jgi:hypothetical protein
MERIERYFDRLQLPEARTREFDSIEVQTLAIIDDIIFEEGDNRGENFSVLTFGLYKKYGITLLGLSNNKGMERVAMGLQQRMRASGN